MPSWFAATLQEARFAIHVRDTAEAGTQLGLLEAERQRTDGEYGVLLAEATDSIDKLATALSKELGNRLTLLRQRIIRLRDLTGTTAEAASTELRAMVDTLRAARVTLANYLDKRDQAHIDAIVNWSEKLSEKTRTSRHPQEQPR